MQKSQNCFYTRHSNCAKDKKDKKPERCKYQCRWQDYHKKGCQHHYKPVFEADSSVIQFLSEPFAILPCCLTLPAADHSAVA